MHKHHKSKTKQKTGKLVGINGTYGFAEMPDGKRYFIPGRFLRGALPGDTVSLGDLPAGKFTGTNDEAEILDILEFGEESFIGTIENIDGYAYIRPDMMPRELITVAQSCDSLYEGDKIQFNIISRGRRHSDHSAAVIGVFGDSELGSVCVDAMIASTGVKTDFPDEVLEEAQKLNKNGIPSDEYDRRLDLRQRVIFTIDSADTKDIDDAISVKKVNGGWEVGVHIADVSHYVRRDTALDAEAFTRGTSIYYADKVIPMLPKALSNGICSLNPNEDRLAFSCLMRLDEKGKLGLFQFRKTIIRSRVKGVYSEINRILSSDKGNIEDELLNKYDGLFETIYNMDELADVLIKRRQKRGAPEIETDEAKVILDSDGVCIDIKKRERGRSERIIEELMLVANTAAAKLAKEQEIPFVYRVHEKPPEQKVKDLSDFLLHVGIKPTSAEPSPKEISKILEAVSAESIKPAVNMMVLRTMSKAKYDSEPIGHYGLAVEDYAHFTSPIRRYPDLAIHRILTDLCYKKKPIEKICKKFRDYADKASLQSTKTELVAVDIERKAQAIYAAEYLKSHLGDVFDGIIMTVLRTGFFVSLENTAEGFVRLDSLPKPPYDYDGYISLTKNGKRRYTVGDSIKVQVAKVELAPPRIDFVVVE
jgi:ribonuclease R